MFGQNCLHETKGCFAETHLLKLLDDVSLTNHPFAQTPWPRRRAAIDPRPDPQPPADAESARKKKLILHIGVHRTGSTAIQRALHANRDALQAQGFHYALDSENHTWMAFLIDQGPSSAADIVDRLVEDSLGTSANTIIVSGEDLSRVRHVSRLAGLKSVFDIQVVCYLRRQDEWLESWYNQHVKWPWDPVLSTLTPQQFLDRRRRFHWLHYGEMLRRWRKLVGLRQITVVPFERGQITGSVVEDFCSRCGVDPAKLDLSGRVENASVSAQTLTLLRQLNLYGKQGQQRSKLVSAVSQAFAAAGLAGTRHVFSPMQRRQIALEYAAGNAAVAREYLARDDGRLFVAPLPDEDPTAPDLELPPMPSFVERIAKPLIITYLEPLARLSRQSGLLPEHLRAHYLWSRERSGLLARRASVDSTISSHKALLLRFGSQLLGRKTDHSGHLMPKAPCLVRAAVGEASTTLGPVAAAFESLLGGGELSKAAHDLLVETLLDWQSLRKADASINMPDDPEAFAREWMEPLIDLLGHRLTAAQRAASNRSADAEPDPEEALRQLAADVTVLESRISTPWRTLRQLWSLLRAG
jgi:transcriptional regulator with XRE-family HTH domain